MPTDIIAANALIGYALTASDQERLDKVAAMAPIDAAGDTEKTAVLRLNKLLIRVKSLRDELAVSLQQEPWRAVQLPLFGVPGREDA